jgi:hypothetical protein
MLVALVLMLMRLKLRMLHLCRDWERDSEQDHTSAQHRDATKRCGEAGAG